MNEILSKRQLAPDVWQMKVKAPHIAAERKAGQFVILQVDSDFGERIPLTIADANPETGTITLVFQSVGHTTHKLADFPVDASIPNVLGPLGRPTDVHKVGTVVCIGGGIGVAPMHPIAQAMKAAGNKVIVIIGARTKDLVIFEEEMRNIADELIIMTDDGSYGTKGLVTQPLKTLCESPTPPDEVIAIGPPIMMKFCAETTRPFKVKTTVSLNTIMIDGTGMCGGCRVNIGGVTKFVCVDGPEFDGHLVDWDNMMKRMKAYTTQENVSHTSYHNHACNLYASIRQT